MLLDGSRGAAALLEQLPRARRPPARARGGRRGGDALRRRRRRLAADLGNMALHRELEGRLAAFKGYRGGAALRVRLPGEHRRRRGARRRAARSSSPTSSTTPASSTAAGSRGRETFVYRHRDTEHLEWGLREAGGRGAADRHRRRLLDGRRRRAARRAASRSPAGTAAMLAVDEAHGTGALGPGGRGAVAAAGLTGEVDVIVGTLGKALGGYGAYVCAVAEIVELLVNTARPFIFSTAPPPPRWPRRSPRSSCWSAPRPGRAAAPQRGHAARGAREPGPRRRAARGPRSSR